MSGGPGFSVRIFIPDGEPEGLRMVEKSNWVGQGTVFPRARFGAARQRSELTRTGVYILWGPSKAGQLPRVYVGEGERVVVRLDQHARSKDFWTHAVVFTSKDQSLNSASVQYLESRLIERASQAKRAELENGTVPRKPTLTEADKADVESFLSDLLLCLPVVGVTFFDVPQAAQPSEGDLFIRAKGIEARGNDGPDGFVVRLGSQAVGIEVPKISEHLSGLRRELAEQGVLVPDGGSYRFAVDYAFNSPSTAASVVLGVSSNGRLSWKDSHGQTLGAIQEAALA